MDTKTHPLAKRGKALMGMLMACLLALTLATPAHAEAVAGTCTATQFGVLAGTVVTNANYVVDGAFHTWTQLAGTVVRGPVFGGGNSNNVNFTLLQDNIPVFINNSPDNLASGQTYTVQANVRLPDSSAEQVVTEGIVDLSGLPDPSCRVFSPIV